MKHFKRRILMAEKSDKVKKLCGGGSKVECADRENNTCTYKHKCTFQKVSSERKAN
jgi:hypothetical protein